MHQSFVMARVCTAITCNWVCEYTCARFWPVTERKEHRHRQARRQEGRFSVTGWLDMIISRRLSGQQGRQGKGSEGKGNSRPLQTGGGSASRFVAAPREKGIVF